MPARRRRPATGSSRSGSTAASTHAQPERQRQVHRRTRREQHQVRSSRGSSTFPSARPPSAGSPPSSSVHTVDGTPDTTAPTSPALQQPSAPINLAPKGF